MKKHITAALLLLSTLHTFGSSSNNPLRSPFRIHPEASFTVRCCYAVNADPRACLEEYLLRHVNVEKAPEPLTITPKTTTKETNAITALFETIKKTLFPKPTKKEQRKPQNELTNPIYQEIQALNILPPDLFSLLHALQDPNETVPAFLQNPHDPNLLAAVQGARLGAHENVDDIWFGPGDSRSSRADSYIVRVPALEYACTHRIVAAIPVLMANGARSPDSLSKAALNNQIHVARALIDGRADVNVVVDEYGTPLCKAICHLAIGGEGPLQMITMLLEAHADPNKGTKNENPLDLAQKIAIHQKDRPNVIELLKSYGAKIKAECDKGA